MKKESNRTTRSSLGTTIAETERAKANNFSEEKRERLLNQGMALIYGAKGKAKTPVHRG